MLSRLLVSMTLCAFAFLIRVVAIYLLAVHESDFEGVLQSFLLNALLYYIPEVVKASCEQLGISTEGKTLIEQATEAWRVLGC